MTDPLWEDYWGRPPHEWFVPDQYQDVNECIRILDDEDSHEHDFVNGLLDAAMKDIKELIESYNGRNSEAIYDQVEEQIPRLVYEWCFFYDNEVTTEVLDNNMVDFVAWVLDQFHRVITEEGGWEVEWMPPCARAVRSRMFDEGSDDEWEDEHP